MTQPKDRLRELPSIDRLLHHTKSEALLARFSRAYVTRQCRELLDAGVPGLHLYVLNKATAPARILEALELPVLRDTLPTRLNAQPGGLGPGRGAAS